MFLLLFYTIADWAKTNLSPGCQHQAIIVRGGKPKKLPEFLWINTLLGNLKTSLGGVYHAVDYAKYAARYLT